MVSAKIVSAVITSIVPAVVAVVVAAVVPVIPVVAAAPAKYYQHSTPIITAPKTPNPIAIVLPTELPP